MTCKLKNKLSIGLKIRSCVLEYGAIFGRLVQLVHSAKRPFSGRLWLTRAYDFLPVVKHNNYTQNKNNKFKMQKFTMILWKSLFIEFEKINLIYQKKKQLLMYIFKLVLCLN